MKASVVCDFQKKDAKVIDMIYYRTYMYIYREWRYVVQTVRVQ